MTNPTEESLLDAEIARLHGELKLHDPESDQYPKIMESIQKLYTLRKAERPEEVKPPEKRRVSPDTVLLVAGNLLGIVAILAYEHAHPITSKALGFVMKLKA